MWGVACGGDSCGLMYRGLGIWVGYADGGDSWGGFGWCGGVDVCAVCVGGGAVVVERGGLLSECIISPFQRCLDQSLKLRSNISKI